jgi:hypothetical protein
MQYWTGSEWTGEKVWNGQAWADAATGSSVAVSSEVAVSTVQTRPPTTFLALCGGAAAIALGALLPWAEAGQTLGGTVTVSPPGGGVVFLWALAGAVVWLSFTALHGSLSMPRRLGLTALAALLTLFVFSNFSAVSQYEDLGVRAGTGLYLYSAGVVAVVVGVVRAWFTSLRKATS